MCFAPSQVSPPRERRGNEIVPRASREPKRSEKEKETKKPNFFHWLGTRKEADPSPSPVFFLRGLLRPPPSSTSSWSFPVSRIFVGFYSSLPLCTPYRTFFYQRRSTRYRCVLGKSRPGGNSTPIPLFFEKYGNPHKPAIESLKTKKPL